METKTYKKAEIRIVRFDESDVILSSGDSVIDVFNWFENGQEFAAWDERRDENG